MRVLINGEPRELPDGAVLASVVPIRPGVAAAVNGSVVRGWNELVLSDGDAVEVLTAFQGG